jgi:N-acetyl-alpha-D-glucosaminyl L-malate synthase BshA
MEKDKLKLGFLSFYHPHLGGSGIVASRLMANLAREGHEIHVIGYDTDHNPPEMESLGVKLHNVNRIDYPCLKNEPYDWTLASRAVQVHKEHKLDLLHAHYAIPHALAAMVAKQQLALEGEELPYVVTCHGSDIHTNGSKLDLNPALNLALNSADAITYVSEDLKRKSNSFTNLAGKGSVVKNFVDTEVFYNDGSNMRASLGIPKNAFVIGHASNFAPIKQVSHFADLAKSLDNQSKLDGVYFLMCGDGKARYELEDRLREDGTLENFKFVGKLSEEDMRTAYGTMDVFSLTSKREGSPLTVLEAMACELPIVSTKYSSKPEFVNGVGGLTFDSGDLESFVRHVDDLRGNSDLRKEMGSASKALVEKEFSVAPVMEAYREVYREVLEKSKGALGTQNVS